MKAIVSFGRMNPPTVGHQLLIDKLISEGRKLGFTPILFLSKSEDKKKNPVPYKDKVKFVKKFFSEIKLVDEASIKTPINMLTWLGENGYTDVIMVAGSDRVEGYSSLSKYNGKDFTLDTFKVISAGERDPDSDDASGMSASKMRGFVKAGDFDAFKKGLPKKASSSDALNLYKIIGDHLNEELDEILQTILGEDYV